MKILADQARVTVSDTEHVQLNSGKRRSAQADLDDPAQIVKEVFCTIAERRWEDRHEELQKEKRDIAEKRRLELHYELQSRLLEASKPAVETTNGLNGAVEAADGTGKPGIAVGDDRGNDSGTAGMSLNSLFSSHWRDRSSVSPEGGQDRMAGIKVEEREILDDESSSSHVEDVKNSEVPEFLVMKADTEDDGYDENDLDEPPAVWIMQPDGIMVKNPEADIWAEEHANDGPAPRRRWPSVDIGKSPVALNPPLSLCPRPRCLPLSEGAHRAQLDEKRFQPTETILESLEPLPTFTSLDPLGKSQESADYMTSSQSLQAEYDMINQRVQVDESETHPRHARRGLDIHATAARFDGSAIPLASDDVIPSIEDYFCNIPDDEWLDTVPEEPVQRELGLTTITTQPSQSEEILPYRPRRSPSLLRTETLVEDVFENTAILTPVIDPLRSMDDILSLERQDTVGSSPAPLTPFTTSATEPETPAMTSVPSSPHGGTFAEYAAIDDLARQQVEGVARAFGVPVEGDEATSTLSRKGDGYETTWGLTALSSNQTSQGNERRGLKQSAKAAEEARTVQRACSARRRGEEIVAEGGRIRRGSVQREIAGMAIRMARSPTPAPEGMEGRGAVREDEGLRKSEGEVHVSEEMEGVEMEGGGEEDDGNGAPLTKVLSRAA